MEKQTNQESEMIREKMKQRPINKKKLLRRTIITVLMAVVFGTVACLTFLLLEPIISNRLYPEEGPDIIEFTEEAEDEILPEDMIADDAEMQAENQEPIVLEEEEIQRVLDAIKLDASDYLTMYQSLNDMVREVRKSMVTVRGVSSDTDWFNNIYENEDVTSGVLLADNGKELLILANSRGMEDAEMIKVAFQDGGQYEASVKDEDKDTGLMVLSISKSSVKKETLETIQVISQGSSAGNSLQGLPVIAVGRPVSNVDSMAYGIITSGSGMVHQADARYKLLNTDIYGSSNASGILINVRGQMVGIIDNSYNSSDTGNLVSGLGISDLLELFNKMTNGGKRAYMGIFTIDVTDQVNEELGVPYGAYITEIELDSPAMEAGIQSGDVIIKIGSADILRSKDYIDFLMQAVPDQTVRVTVLRQGPEGYSQMSMNVVLGERD